MNSNQKGPLSPHELFNRLLHADYREAQCEDQADNLRQQREVLIQLNLEYEQEIERARVGLAEEQALLELKERMICDLEVLRNQRGAIEAQVTEEIETLRATPVEIREQASWMAEFTEVRGRNNKMKIRIRDLMGYIAKLELQNKRLEEERRVIEAGKINARAVGENWRERIDSLQKEHLSYEYELRQKMRDKEEQALRSVQTQQLQIRERNRVRMMSGSSSKYVGGYPPTFSDLAYFRRI